MHFWVNNSCISIAPHFHLFGRVRKKTPVYRCQVDIVSPWLEIWYNIYNSYIHRFSQVIVRRELLVYRNKIVWKRAQSRKIIYPENIWCRSA